MKKHRIRYVSVSYSMLFHNLMHADMMHTPVTPASTHSLAFTALMPPMAYTGISALWQISFRKSSPLGGKSRAEDDFATEDDEDFLN